MSIPRLDYTPSSSRYSGQHGAGIISTNVEGGFPRLRRDQLQPPSTFRVQWVFGRDDFEDFMFAFRHTINSGATTFIIPLLLDYSDMIDYTAQLVPNSLRVTNAEGNRRVVTASIVGIPVVDLAGLDNIVACYDSIRDYLATQAELARLTNESCPDVTAAFDAEYYPVEVYETGASGMWIDPSHASKYQDPHLMTRTTQTGEVVSRIGHGYGNDMYLVNDQLRATKPIYHKVNGKQWLSFSPTQSATVHAPTDMHMGAIAIAFRSNDRKFLDVEYSADAPYDPIAPIDEPKDLGIESNLLACVINIEAGVFTTHTANGSIAQSTPANEFLGLRHIGAWDYENYPTRLSLDLFQLATFNRNLTEKEIALMLSFLNGKLP